MVDRLWEYLGRAVDGGKTAAGDRKINSGQQEQKQRYKKGKSLLPVAVPDTGT